MLETLSNPSSSKVTLEEFQESVDLLASTKTAFVFDSEGTENAAIIISSIFKYADHSVKIYASNMNGDISDFEVYTDSLHHFLYERKRLQILLDTPEYFLPNHPEWQSKRLQRLLLRFYSQGNIELRIAPQAFKDDLRGIATDGQSLYHFVVGDAQMVRIEINAGDRSSICSFNNPRMAGPLLRVFDKHFSSAEKINLADIPEHARMVAASL